MGFWKRLTGGADEPLAELLASVSRSFLSAYEPMRDSQRRQGIDGPDANPDGGLTLFPYVYLRRMMRLGADPDFRSVPRFYPNGVVLPEPFLSLGPRGSELDAEGIRALLDRTIGPAPARIPTLFLGFTALHLVAESDRTAAIPVLVAERGVAPVARSAHGDTALHIACLQGSLSTARALLAHDPDRVAGRTRNEAGLTPLGVCASLNRPAAIDLLYEAGITMSTPDQDEMLVAARWGCREAFERLRDLSGISGARLGELEEILADAVRRQSS